MKIRLCVYFFCLVVVLTFISACTNKRNTLITRTYHNITSRYNGYYWATESIKDGQFKIESNHTDDYSHILPLFIYPDANSSKSIYPEMDRAIKKSSLVIQRHAIIDKKTKKEVYGAVKWIDDNWLVIGQAHFYKREFFSAVEIFDFVAKSYKSKQREEAKLWLIRTYNEIGTLSQSEPLIADLKNKKDLPREFQRELSALISEYYIKQGLYDEAAKELKKTVEITRKKKQKARYLFVLAQIYEAAKNNKEAIKHYNKCIALKPSYDMNFNAHIKRARLYDAKDKKTKGVRQELLKMAKDPKNVENLDVIYYTLGEIEESDQNIDLAMGYYRKSAQASVNNNNQKGLSYLKLADNSFEKAIYVDAGAYYDSAVAVLDKKHPDYETITIKQKNLSTLVQNIKIIHTQDSLQKLAKMDSIDRDVIIARLIKAVEDEEQKKKDELEQLKNSNDNSLLNNNNEPNNNTVNALTNGGEWYYYNQQTKAFGINEFVKKFGNRKLEDNWRRANKQSADDIITGGGDEEVDDTTGVVAGGAPKVDDRKTREYYLQNLPLTEKQLNSSNDKILEAFYQLGSVYREALNNRPKAMAAFEEMNKRFPGNKYEANTWYQSYRMSVQEKNTVKADEYKNKLLSKYPDSDYARILNDPDYQNTVNAKKNEVEQYYAETYTLFTENKTREAVDRAQQALKKYGTKNDFSSRFALLHALGIGKLHGMDSMQTALTAVIARYGSDASVKEKAQEILNYIMAQKGQTSQLTQPQAEQFAFAEEAKHFYAILLPKNFNGVNSFTAKLSDFNNKYFSGSNLQITSIEYNGQPLLFVKEFENKAKAMDYFSSLDQNTEPFDGAALAKNKCTYFVATQENFQKLIQQKKLDEYYQFFLQRYEPGAN